VTKLTLGIVVPDWWRFLCCHWGMDEL